MEKSIGEKAETERTHDLKQSKLLLMIVATVAVVVIVILVGVIIYLLRKPADQPIADDKRGVDGVRATVLTEENYEEVVSQANEPVTDGYYSCKMNVEWNFASAAEPSYNAYVANSTSNTRTVYFDVTLEESGDLVYSSPYIPVGEELREITLDTELPAGDYSAIVTYHLVDDDHEELSTVSVAVTLHIEQ